MADIAAKLGRGAFQATPRVVLVGSPNVGKSVIFNALTGAYVTVSNYPGTTVEVTRGRARARDGGWFWVIDTPGMYSLLPITEEERVTRRLLLEEHPDVVVHVVDAKNLARMLPLTLELLEAGLTVILCVNMMDEAERLGLTLDTGLLSEKLGISVVPAVSLVGRGIPELLEEIQRRIVQAPESPREIVPRVELDYGPRLEGTIARIMENLKGDYPISKRSLAVLLLGEDEDAWEILTEREAMMAREAIAPEERIRQVRGAVDSLKRKLPHHPAYELARLRHREAASLSDDVTSRRAIRRARGLLDRLTLNPITGFPILALVVYFGLFKFVGGFGAGTLVDFLEASLFEAYINPLAERLASALPYPALTSLIAGDYGVFTLALRYAVAIILPIVGSFFLVFSLIEDSGYLPRLAMLVDRWFKVIGLSGRAIIPMVLGFGCDTMATIVTRTLETRRERIIATFLLALAIPCSAQLGVILGILAGHPAAMATWTGFVGLSFILSGYLAKRILPGQPPSFYMELPPLRVPQLGNVLTKTWARMRWYFLEVVPIFVMASVIMWLGDMTGLLQTLLQALKPLTATLGLPEEAARAFIFGFFRRDYGAAGLFDLHKAGLLSVRQMTVAAVTLTLFIPCIAQFSVMVKERGPIVTLVMALIIFPFAFAMGFLVNQLLVALGVGM